MNKLQCDSCPQEERRLYVLSWGKKQNNIVSKIQMYHVTSLNLEKIVCHSGQNQETNDATIFPLELK